MKIFLNSFGAFHLSPRTINSSYIGKIVCVEGIVNKCKILEMIKI